MKILNFTADKLAVGFSGLCAVHCLALPLMLTLIPSMASLSLYKETFHAWMVVAVIPTSAYALTRGCRTHKEKTVVFYGLLGLSGLIASVLLGEHNLGEVGEKLITVVSSSIIAYAHVRNFKLCQAKDNCLCSQSHL